VSSRTQTHERSIFHPDDITAVVNVGSGEQKQHEIAEILRTVFSGQDAALQVRFAKHPRDIFIETRRAVDAGRRLVLACGGDGTISAVASVLAGTETLLGVLPSGTFNFFARLLRVPLDLEGAARTLFDGEVEEVSLGEVNGRVFVNNASIGLYPSLLREREELYSRWGRSQFAAYVAAAWGLLRRRRYLEVEVILDDKKKTYLTPMIFAAHNRYQIEEFGMPGGPCIDQGRLAFYVLPPTGRLGLLRLGWRMLRRSLRPAQDFHLLCSNEALIHTKRSALNVAYDGELVRMNSPFVFRLRSKAIRVLIPRSPDSVSEAA